MDSDKEEPVYGPWLLVSYGKQGNRFNKGKSGRNGSGNINAKRSDGGGNPSIQDNNGSSGTYSGSGNVGARRSDGGGNSNIPSNNGGPGKYMGNGNANARRSDGVGSSSGLNNSEQVKGVAKFKNNVPAKPSNAGKSNGSREVASFTKNTPSSDKDKMCSSSPIEPDPDIIDSASVLRQLHNEVTNFETQTSSMDGITVSLTQNDTSNNIVGVDKFETIASDLKEALAVISE
ncbi:hypothetical protein Q3G72_007333 [Acer saccharum]|nr:hypothetical protein Q3G72_007333 [Acer saccharum]